MPRRRPALPHATQCSYTTALSSQFTHSLDGSHNSRHVCSVGKRLTKLNACNLLTSNAFEWLPYVVRPKSNMSMEESSKTRTTGTNVRQRPCDQTYRCYVWHQSRRQAESTCDKLVWFDQNLACQAPGHPGAAWTSPLAFKPTPS